MATKQQRPTGDGAASAAVLAECERPPRAQPSPGEHEIAQVTTNSARAVP